MTIPFASRSGRAYRANLRVRRLHFGSFGTGASKGEATPRPMDHMVTTPRSVRDCLDLTRPVDLGRPGSRTRQRTGSPIQRNGRQPHHRPATTKWSERGAPSPFSLEKGIIRYVNERLWKIASLERETFMTEAPSPAPRPGMRRRPPVAGRCKPKKGAFTCHTAASLSVSLPSC
jgi:hypothetical protein